MQKNKIKILELTNYSSGICGVWQRVKQESLGLSKKGYEVRVFSSNAVKGSQELATSQDNIDNVKIFRFPFRKLGGESFMNWDFKKQALQFEPDIIIAHSYRHRHTHKAIKIKNLLEKKGKNCKIFLVTHAPFDYGESSRPLISKIVVWIYDRFIGPRILKNFDKIISITKWENSFLFHLGVHKDRIFYVPNGIPEEFFSKSINNKPKKHLFFLGRISPIKNLEVLIRAMKNINSELDIIGPKEKFYFKKLQTLILTLKLKTTSFKDPIYDLNKKINLIDRYGIFVLPSVRESMPQSLIESMARGKIVISSDNLGSKEIIVNNKNGFIFKTGNSNELSKIIKKVLNLSPQEKIIVSKNARKSVEKFKESNLLKDLEILFHNS